MISFDTNYSESARIKVIGIGGGGGNAINNMVMRRIEGVEFIAANTDKQALSKNNADNKIQLGLEVSRGLGAGANPEIGKRSVEESKDEIRDVLKGSDMIFVTAGMGGGTGTGGAPTIAQIGKEIGALVVGIVTKPFDWEGIKRKKVAEEWIEELRKNVDSLIVIPNNNLLSIIDKNTTMKQAYEKVDEVLYNATRGIAEIITHAGYVNVDFADVKTIMKDMGNAIMGIGYATGENRALTALKEAINSPLLDNHSIRGAKGVLVNFTGGEDMTMNEINEAMTFLNNECNEETTIIQGVVNKDEMTDQIMVTIVATGFDKIGGVAETKAEEVIAEIEEIISLEEKIETAPVEYKNNTAEAAKLEIVQESPAPAAQRIINATADRTPKGPALRDYDVPAIIRQKPKGADELKRFDQPAIQRRNPEFSNLNEVRTTAESRVSNSFDNLSYGNKQTIAFSENPAFLRRILD